MIKYIEFNEQKQIIKIVGVCKAGDFRKKEVSNGQTSFKFTK